MSWHLWLHNSFLGSIYYFLHSVDYMPLCVTCHRRLDDNIRTVVRGQTNVGQDGRQVRGAGLINLNFVFIIYLEKWWKYVMDPFFCCLCSCGFQYQLFSKAGWHVCWSAAKRKTVVNRRGVRVNHMRILYIHPTQQHPSPEGRMVH